MRPYQQRMTTRLYESDATILIARMGAGKTAVALTAINELIRDGVIRHALVIAPKRVARNVWPEALGEWEHTAGMSYAVLDGPPAQRAMQLMSAEYRELTIVGIDLIPWLLDELKQFPSDHPLFDLLVIDEISRLRNPTGVRAKALAKVASKWRLRWGLTGTLRPSSALDLFMPARVITCGQLWGKSYDKWKRTYFFPTDFQGYNWAPFPDAEDKLNAAIAPLIETLDAGDMPQMPALTVIRDQVTLPPAARERYTTMHNQLIAHGDKTKDEAAIIAASAGVATGKLAQIANGFLYEEDGSVRYLHYEKCDWLTDLVENADAPTLLVYEFIEDLELMQEVVRNVTGRHLPHLGYGVTDAQATQHIDWWNKRELPFMALHPASGGHGLNLQHGGSLMAWIAPTWSPENWEQTLARLHRPGQTEPVVVRVCVAEATVDDLKLNRVHRKMSAQAAFEQYLRDVSSASSFRLREAAHAP